MFGSKKPPVSEMPWAIQVLTTEYLMDGTVQPDVYRSPAYNGDLFVAASDTVGESGLKTFQFLHLTAVQVKPTGNLTTPVQSFSEWRLAACANVVAIIPNDDASQQAAQKAFKHCKYPVGAVVYAGPYRIRGTALSDSAGSLHAPLMTEWSLLPIQEAEIDSQLPGLDSPA